MPEPIGNGPDDGDEKGIDEAILKKIGGELPLYRLPFDPGSGWSVGNGNWDDPQGGHGVSQAYAFDIGHAANASGKTVRTARSGYVASVRNDIILNAGSWKDDDWAKYLADHPGETREAIGGGSHVLIRQADDTVAAYLHLTANQSLVTKKGQFVAQGQPIGLADNTGSSGGPHLHFDVRLFWNAYTDYGPTIPVQFQDANHIAWRPRDGQPLEPDNNYRLQEGWRWCKKCLGLFYGVKPLSGSIGGVCPAQGAHEQGSSVNYVLAFSAVMIPAGQSGWRWCQKCQGLFYGGNPGSVCPAGDAHHVGSGNYSLVLNMPAAPGQHGWRWCQKCQGLWLEHAGSRCPAGGEHHVGTGEYMLWKMRGETSQQHWRWCQKCQGLFFGDNPASVCPTGDGHQVGSGNYILVHDMADAPGQPGWRWCQKCQGLFYGGNPGSVCPAGDGHHVGSGNYTLLL
ncbi:MAG TPA: M23 family metallopeptidase [Chloroflexota bacterium]